MDVFGQAMQASGFLRDAAIAAAAALGVFAALREPMTAAELAAALAVGERRLRALLEVLAAMGVLRVAEPGFAEPGLAPGSPRGHARYARAAVPAEIPVIAAMGWGRLAEVIRRDRPVTRLDADAERGVETGQDARAGQGATWAAEGERRYHRHLAEAGAAAAAELMAKIVDRTGAVSLLDIGAGAGTYSKALLALRDDATATLVDLPSVLALAEDWLGPLAARARFASGDATTVRLAGDYGVALLANVLHLHSPGMCQQLLAVAAAAVAPGGHVVIKDLRVDDDHRGPLEGLLFALNMAIYTEAGDVYDTATLRRWLGEAGLTDIAQIALARSPDAIALIARRPRAPWDDVASPEVLAELDARAMPRGLRGFLAAAIATSEDATALRTHYLETMPAMRRAQLPDALLQTPLDWTRLPRLAAALDRLFAVLGAAGVDPTTALGAPTAAALRARAPTLAALYATTHYGGFMPLLYGAPADLAYIAARGHDAHAAIDRYLTAPFVHELCHFARERRVLFAPHLDECLAGWLGVYVHPELAYPTGDHDDALYAAPWLSQVGQAIARVFGRDAVIRAHAGDAAALPARFVAAAAQRGWDDWCARRTLHFLSDTFDPAPWIALALAHGALRDDPAADRAIVEDGLRAMCLRSERVDGSFRTRAALPDAPIAIDDAIHAAAPRALDPIAPRYWLPPPVAARMAGRGVARYSLALASLAAIPAAAAAICAASDSVATDGFVLAREPA